MSVESVHGIDMYRALVGIRLAERAITDLNDQGVLRDHHSGLGQEAIAVGVAFAVRADDCMLGTHRSRMILACARGFSSLRELVLSEFGLAPGPSSPIPGRPRMLVKMGLIGSGLPMAVGVAMADRLRGKDTVTVACFGDGAANEGAVHEAMNLAGSRRLPMVFVVENNGFSISMPVRVATAAEGFASRAVGYGMPGNVVDGSDVLAVHELAGQAVSRARSGRGPSLIEARTTRWEAHAGGIPDLRTPEEMAEARRRDGLSMLRETLTQRGILNEGQAAAIEDACRREVEAAVEEGRSAGAGPSASPTLSAAEARQLTYAG